MKALTGRGWGRTWKLLERVWNREGFPEEWRTGIIYPIQERRKGHTKELQRHNTPKYGIRNLHKHHKRQTQERNRRETAGGTIWIQERERNTDAIFTINYMVDRELSKKNGRIFVDLDAAFDKLDR